MVRRSLIVTTLLSLLLALPAAADALTLAQVKAQGANAADDLAAGLGLELAISNDQVDITVKGSASECRKTSRTRGTCVIDAEETTTGAWCSGTAVIRQAGKRLLWSTRAVQCGDASAG